MSLRYSTRQIALQRTATSSHVCSERKFQSEAPNEIPCKPISGPSPGICLGMWDKVNNWPGCDLHAGSYCLGTSYKWVCVHMDISVGAWCDTGVNTEVALDKYSLLLSVKMGHKGIQCYLLKMLYNMNCSCVYSSTNRMKKKMKQFNTGFYFCYFSTEVEFVLYLTSHAYL